jgi:hypothetical protein
VILPRLDDPLDTDSQARWLIVAVLGPADDSRSHSRLRTSSSTTGKCVPFFSLAAARPNASQRNPALSFGLGLAFVVVLSRRPGHEDGMDVPCRDARPAHRLGSRRCGLSRFCGADSYRERSRASLTDRAGRATEESLQLSSQRCLGM